MGAEQFVDVTCRGLEIGKSLKLHDFGPSTAFLEAAAPVPVGSPIEITTDGGLLIAARVLRVQEQVAGAEMPPGMRVAVPDLAGKVKGWWAEQVSRTDPTIPEPVRRPAAAPIDDGIPTEAAIEVTIPSAGVPIMPPGGLPGGDGRRPPASRTQIMSVSEIANAIEAGGQHVDESDGTPSGEMDAMPTDQVSADDADGNGSGNGEAADDPGSSASRKARNKKKKRR